MHCVDKLRSIGVLDRELLNIFDPVALFIMIADSKLLIFDCTDVTSGDLVGLFPVNESRGAG